MINHEKHKRHEECPTTKSVLEMAHQLHDLQQGAVQQTLKSYSPEVDTIVRINSMDQQRIERTLDQLLDVAFDDQVLVLFKQLCRHYYAINPEAAAFYVQSYREMWDESPEEAGK